MKTKHTPGPWREGSTAHSKWVEAGAVRICQVDTDEENAGISFDESEANARLIAAAPDLLEVLALLANWIEESADIPREHILTEARSAIVRARREI